MARADHAAEVDADLNVVDQERFLLRRLEVGAEQQGGRCPTTRPYSSPYCGMFSTGSSKPKKQVADPGPLGEPDVLLDLRHARGRGGAGQQLAPEVAGQVDPLLAVAEGRAEGVRRLRLGHAGQHRGGADRAAVALAALDLVSQLGAEHQALGHADRRDERIARLHRHGQPADQRRIEPVPNAAVVGDLHLRRRIEHEAVADALGFRALLVQAVQLASRESPRRRAGLGSIALIVTGPTTYQSPLTN